MLGNTIFFPLVDVDTRIVRRVQKAWRRLLSAGEATGWTLIEADREPTEELMTQIASVSSGKIIIIAEDPQQGRLTAATALRTGLIPVIIGYPHDYRPVLTHLYNGIVTGPSSTAAIATALRQLTADPRRRAAMHHNAYVNQSHT